jgi:hypothetical protein
MNAQNIRERMEVYGSCGNRLRIVGHVEGNSIKLTKSSSADGQHHYLPLDWVDHVDQHVHLNKGCDQAKKEWNAAPLAAGG